MNPYSLELLARDRIATFHDEAAGTRTPRRPRGHSTRFSRLFARLGAPRGWLHRTDQRKAALESTTGVEPRPA